MSDIQCSTPNCGNFSVSGGKCHDCISDKQSALVYVCPECNAKVIEFSAPYCPLCKTHTHMTIAVTDITCYQRCESGSSATWVEPFRPEDSSPVASVTRTQHARTSAASAFSGDLHALRLHRYSIGW